MKTKVLYYTAAAATAIAGILHLMLAPNMLNFNPNGTTLFFVGGAAQVFFWALSMVRRWVWVWDWNWRHGGSDGDLGNYEVSRQSDNWQWK